MVIAPPVDEFEQFIDVLTPNHRGDLLIPRPDQPSHWITTARKGFDHLVVVGDPLPEIRPWGSSLQKEFALFGMNANLGGTP